MSSSVVEQAAAILTHDHCRREVPATRSADGAIIALGRRLKHFPPKWTPVRRRKCDKRMESKAHPGSISCKHDSI